MPSPKGYREPPAADENNSKGCGKPGGEGIDMSDGGLSRAVSAARLFDGERWLQDHSVILSGERVTDLIPQSQLPAELPCQALDVGMLAPGFIDLQVNGGGGVMLNNQPCSEAVVRIVQGHRSRGTTAIMPTLISDSQDIRARAVAAVRTARAEGNCGVLGIHLEGPFFDLSRRGTHKAEMIRPPLQEDIDWLCSIHDMAVIATLAPEHVPVERLRQLVDAGIHVCAGHTNASHTQIQTAIEAGLRGFTHLFNAMSPLTAREPGTVGAALDSDDTWVGIIADGHHVHPAAVRIAYRSKSRGKLLLVSDAMATVGSDNPEFEIYGERIRENEGRLVNAEGVLAGSAIGMIDAVRIAHQQVGLPLAECLRMGSLYPAQFLGFDDSLGRIAAGHRADFVHFNEQFQVLNTWVAGSHCSHKGFPS